MNVLQSFDFIKANIHRCHSYKVRRISGKYETYNNAQKALFAQPVESPLVWRR